MGRLDWRLDWANQGFRSERARSRRDGAKTAFLSDGTTRNHATSAETVSYDRSYGSCAVTRKKNEKR